MLIRLETQAVTTADLGQEHGILACLDFRLVLSFVEIPVDLCILRCSIGMSWIDLFTQLRAAANETGHGGSSVIVAASLVGPLCCCCCCCCCYYYKSKSL